MNSLKNAEYCLFKQRELTGNGNYTVGIMQDGELKRVFFMLDSNGCKHASAASMANGHTVRTAGFGTDQIEWYTELAKDITELSPETKLTFAFHIQLDVFKDAFAKYGFVNSGTYKPVNLDTHPDKADSDFGYLGAPLKDPWDADRSVYNGLKALGVDSILVGHEHGNSGSVVYDGIRFQYGQKSSTYDRANYVESNGTISNNMYYGDMSEVRIPLVGATVMPLSKEDGTLKNPYIYLCREIDWDSYGEQASVDGLQYGSDLSCNATISVQVANVGGENAWQCTASQQAKLYVNTSLVKNKSTLKFSVYVPDTSTAKLGSRGEFSIRVKTSSADKPTYSDCANGYIDYSTTSENERLKLSYGTWQTFTVDISGFSQECTEFSFVLPAGNTIYLRGVTIE